MRLVYLYAYNNPAIRLYNRLMFRCVRRLNGFYLIKRQHFDAFLFVYFVNGSRSPCSPLEVAMFVVNYMKNGIKSVASKLTRKEEQGMKWLVCKDTDCVLPTQTKPNLGSSSSGEPPLQIPNGTLDLSLLWYGQFTPVQKERVQDFIESLNFDSKEGLDPKVSAWWKVVESYQERYEVKEIYQQKSNRTVAPRIKVKIVRSFVDEKMKYGTELTIENGEKLVETATENMSKVVPVVLLSAQVRSQGLGFCNKTCQRYALTLNGKEKPQPYVMVSDPEVQCPGECAWPFHIANEGPHGMTYQPPSGEIGADALVIQLATGLADVATNPALSESLFKSEPPYITEGNHISSDYIVDPATKCTRVFGSGAFPGFTGRIRVDPVTGGAFNSHGINHLKFLIPSVWDPKTKSCWTPM
ncbi:BnaCnng06140D [Brassica napus]|uniref:BnaCnng06140D protein n=1 Tax=Brassica napus TaxID=3708 RepID=A0A078GVP0_BRANA|nr:BnaCnng06140D [Brassica napus]